MSRRYLPIPSRARAFILLVVVALAVLAAVCFASAGVRADPEIPPPANTALLEPADHVVSPVSARVEAATMEVTPLKVPAEQVASSPASAWPYVGVTIGIAILGATALVLLLHRKRWRGRLASLLLIVVLSSPVSITATAHAQTLNITSWTCPTGYPEVLDESIDSAGKIWFVDNYRRPQTIGHLDPVANEFVTWLLPLEAGYTLTTVDGSGGVWFHWYSGPSVDMKKGVGRLDTATNFFTLWPFPQQYVADITADAAGNAWFTYPQEDKIVSLNPATNVITTYSVPTPASDPYGICADSTGNIWFAEYASNKIARLDPDTSVITEWQLPVVNSAPFWVHVVSHQIYFTQRNQPYMIGRLNSVTNEVTEWSIAQVGSAPTYLSADPVGNIWVVSMSNYTIANLSTDNVLRWWTMYSFKGGPTVDADGNAYISGQISDGDPVQIHRLQR